MEDKLKLVQLGMPTQLAVEVSRQIESSSGGGGQALTVAQRAETKADAATTLANEADAAAVEALSAATAAAANTRDAKDLETLLANSTWRYDATGAAQVVAGDVFRTRKEGFIYVAAASGASDHHLTTAGGLKLYVQRGAGGLDPSVRRNVLTFTETLSNAIWTKTDATASATELFEAVTTAQHHVRQSVAAPLRWTGDGSLSANIAPGVGGRFAVLRMTGPSGSAYAIFNPADGALLGTSVTGTGFSVVTTGTAVDPLGGFRVSLTGNGDFVGAQLQLHDGGAVGALSYLGVSGNSVLVTRVQLEQGAPTPYQAVLGSTFP